MNLKNAIAFVSVAGVLTVLSCTNRRTSPKIETEAIKESTDTTLLFNGKTLDGWEATDFGPQGPVTVSGNQIILGMGDGCTGITWQKAFPRADYEVSLDAKRVSGNDFFCGVTFPVGKSP